MTIIDSQVQIFCQTAYRGISVRPMSQMGLKQT
jgi:hypothetical protein